MSPIIWLHLQRNLTCFEMISPAVVADEDDVDSSLPLAIFHKVRDCGGCKVTYCVKPLRSYNIITHSIHRLCSQLISIDLGECLTPYLGQFIWGSLKHRLHSQKGWLRQYTSEIPNSISLFSSPFNLFGYLFSLICVSVSGRCRTDSAPLLALQSSFQWVWGKPL